MYGRGAYDMKGAVAAIMVAAAQATGLRGDVIVTAVADEEFASASAPRRCSSASRADAAIVVEPTDLRLAVAHRGFVGFELETAGVAAHGSRPELGVDAIVKMGPSSRRSRSSTGACRRGRGTRSSARARCTRR